MTLLLLAGTAEARAIADWLAGAGRPAVASLAGATRDPAPLAIPTRIGGFGGAAAFRDYLHEAGITAMLDATHPFAAAISWRSAEIARAAGLPHALLLRPEWQPSAGDNWVTIDREEDAAAHIPPDATVFLATGRQGPERFVNLSGRRVICRRIDPARTPFPFAGGRYLVGRPPFSVEDERELFRDLGIDWLVVKNAGGAASRSKLDAARELGIRVAIIRRPPQPDAPRLATVAEAIDWIGALT